jgi:hypothetical protein
LAQEAERKENRTLFKEFQFADRHHAAPWGIVSIRRHKTLELLWHLKLKVDRFPTEDHSRRQEGGIYIGEIRLTDEHGIPLPMSGSESRQVVSLPRR